MNFNFAKQINPFLEKLDFKSAFDIGESNLKHIPTSDFHLIIDKSFDHEIENLVKWIEIFYQTASKKLNIGTLYFELNEFDINTDMWYIDVFAYSVDGGLDLSDMEWLCEFEADSQEEINQVYKIEGLEKLQKAFEIIDLNTPELQDARDWSEQLIIARFMELIRKVHVRAKAKDLKWAKIPIYFTEHSYDFIVRSEN
jgi:hypothetical protein